MDLFQAMSVYVKVVETGSLTAAAQACGLSTTMVGNHLRALEQRLGVKSGAIAADIQQELDKLLWADLLVLNFPIFWFSAPAMLKGWIDGKALSASNVTVVEPNAELRTRAAGLGVHVATAAAELEHSFTPTLVVSAV